MSEAVKLEEVNPCEGCPCQANGVECAVCHREEQALRGEGTK